MEKSIALCEDEITRLEDEIEQIDKKLADPDWLQDPALFEKYEKLKSALKKVMAGWEKQNNEYEELQKLKTW